MTYVLAINGSPRMKNGNTAKILSPFLEGMKEAGASVEMYYVKQLNVKPCLGNMNCWYNTVGECIIKDDMQNLYPKLREADILVLATPVYIPLPGEMQNLINRLCPIVEPILKFHEGRTRAKFQKNIKISKIVLVSSGGWWEIGNFETVVRIVEELAKDASVEFAGAVLRPHAFLMRDEEEQTKAVIDAAKTAGQQLVKDGKMTKDILKIISQPLISEEELRQHYNKMYERVRDS